MDDSLSVQPQQNRPVDQDDEEKKKRIEPKKPEDKSKFAKTVERKVGTKSTDEEDSNLVSTLKEDDDKEDSIFALARKSTLPKKDRSKDALSTGQNKTDMAGVSDDDEMGLGASDEDGKNKNSNTFNFGQESRADIFQLLATQTQIQTSEFSTKAASLSRQQVADLATQMIEKMTTMKTQGDITTELTLKYPPLFEGSLISIKESTNAKGQFNISFQNLNTEAKALIDLQQSRDSLKQTLQDKGYNVHIIIATTQLEKPEYSQDINPQQDQRQRQQDQGEDSGGQGRQQPQDQ